MPPARFFLLALAALGLLGGTARAIILIGDDESDNLVAPASEAPWDHVGWVGPGGGSGVYLGDRFVLTANHVGTSPVALNGVTYQLDPTFGSGGGMQIGAYDIRLLRLLNDPGLSALPFIGATDNDLSQPVTMIGWGVGRGAAATGGWAWGGAETEHERWATNRTSSTADTTSLPGTEFLTTTFSASSGGPEEGQLANADSGSGLFLNVGGTWKLAGIGAYVETGNYALYDHDPVTPGNQSDHSYYLRMKVYASQIQAAMTSVPEPSSAGLLTAGALLLARRRNKASLPSGCGV